MAVISLFLLAISTSILNYSSALLRNDFEPNDSAARLLEKCFMEVCPTATSPSLISEIFLREQMSLLPINVNITLTLQRVLDVDDLAQTMTVFMTMMLKWNLYCPSPPWPGDNELPETGSCKNFYFLNFNIPMNASQLWIPRLAHLNAASDPYPFDKLAKFPTITPTMSPPQVTTYFYGSLTSSCDMAFFKFPFDTLECGLELELYDMFDGFMVFGDIVYNQDPAYPLLFDTDLWEFMGNVSTDFESNYERWKVRHVQDSQHSVENKDAVKFKLRLKRKVQYYIGTIFVPIIALYILQLCSLLIHPHELDRIGLGMTVVLAYAVVLSLVFAGIPETSETVYLVQIIIAKTIICVLLTIYSLILQPICEKEWMERPINVFLVKKISVIRLVDVAMAVIVTIITFVVDGYYMTLMTQE